MAVEAQEMVLREVREGIAQITLNRPAVANALAPEQRDQLIDLFQAYSRDPGVRVVLLRTVGVPAPRIGEIGVAFVVPAPGGEPPGLEELRELASRTGSRA
jgi:1,4-dihydroxy-2-naphthoyl-CoA synthase